MVKFLEDVGYDGMRHFDAHAHRTEDLDGVKDFAKGCMRTYLMFKEKAKQLNEDSEFKALQAEITELQTDPEYQGLMATYSKENAAKLKAAPLDREKLAERGMKYEKIDQITVEALMGNRSTSQSAS